MTPIGTLLLVEDNEDDITLTLTVLKKLYPDLHVDVCRDGTEAVDYLFRKGDYSTRAGGLPQLVLLDLKLPKMNGFEVLKVIKTDPATKHLTVVMLTSSARKGDLDTAYQTGANSYVIKSVSLKQFSEDIRQLCDYWLKSQGELPGPV